MPITSLDNLGGVLYTLTDDGAIRSNIDGLVITLQARPISIHLVWTGADFNAYLYLGWLRTRAGENITLIGGHQIFNANFTGGSDIFNFTPNFEPSVTLDEGDEEGG